MVVNVHGALIVLKEPVAPDQKLLLKNGTTGEEQECKVVAVGSSDAGKTPVGVAFSEPSPRFWRIWFPPEDWTSRSVDAKRYSTTTPAAPAVPTPAKPTAAK